MRRIRLRRFRRSKASGACITVGRRRWFDSAIRTRLKAQGNLNQEWTLGRPAKYTHAVMMLPAVTTLSRLTLLPL